MIVLNEVCNIQDVSQIANNGVYNLTYKGVLLEVAIQNIHLTNNLFILFSGARNPSTDPIPKFDRWKWANDFPGVTVNISDPSLHLSEASLKIGWYVGNIQLDYAEIISSFATDLKHHLSIHSDNIVFYGSSAGGFAAIRCSSFVPKSSCVAINPQILLENYLSSYYKRFLKVCFGVNDSNALPESVSNRFNAIKSFSRASGSHCYYWQNLNDAHHLDFHYRPFCTAFDCDLAGGISNDGRITTNLFDSGPNHSPELRRMLPEILSQVI